MIKVLCISILSVLPLFAELYEVTVSNNIYTPNEISIEIGDTVKWVNVQGFHNVNGDQSVFPDNPESFSNSLGSAGWEFTYVFTTPGEYNYQCDPHTAFDMYGKVTVSTPIAIKEDVSFSAKELSITQDQSGLVIRTAYPSTLSLSTATGRLITQKNITGEGLIDQPVTKGVYLLHISNTKGTMTQKIIVK